MFYSIIEDRCHVFVGSLAHSLFVTTITSRDPFLSVCNVAKGVAGFAAFLTSRGVTCPSLRSPSDTAFLGFAFQSDFNTFLRRRQRGHAVDEFWTLKSCFCIFSKASVVPYGTCSGTVPLWPRASPVKCQPGALYHSARAANSWSL